MHLLNSVRENFTCVPFVHEVGATIATEYFNESNDSDLRAFCLVTAGPGLTNAVTGIAGAWLESREILIIGGQVKTSDLSENFVRQMGIQEITGTDIVKPICKVVKLVKKPLSEEEFKLIIGLAGSDRPGPVFLEIPIDIQASMVVTQTYRKPKFLEKHKTADINKIVKKILNSHKIRRLKKLIKNSRRPILLLGGGVSRPLAISNELNFEQLNIPIMTTWNGMDRYSSDKTNYFGRPNTWGQRSANVILQQADLLIAVGTRLGIQQTGFNWKQFMPVGKVIQVDIDKSELKKESPKKELTFNIDSAEFLQIFLTLIQNEKKSKFTNWVNFCIDIKNLLPNNEKSNSSNPNYIQPYTFTEILSTKLKAETIVIPCSSGSSFTVPMQAFNVKGGQKVITNKGLASMGYGLSGAIGAALSNPEKKVILIEGDGGFIQNLQELGTLMKQNLDITIFVWANQGYASIRMTQRNYFNGAWIGCDDSTGLGMPTWQKLAESYKLRYRKIEPEKSLSGQLTEMLYEKGPILVEVPIDPEQTYFPKITSQVLPNGNLVSNPLHLMTPELDLETAKKVFKYLSIN